MLRKQLLETSRGRLVSLLQHGGLTADDLASKLGVTTNAVREHLAGMERDGVVERAGQRPGTTRPSQLYELITALRTAVWKEGIKPATGEHEVLLAVGALALTETGPGAPSLDSALGYHSGGPGWVLAALGAGAAGSALAISRARQQPETSQSPVGQAPA